ncbi:MAG TPA: hypothetical protein VK762_14845 [Polyangiaceae bacterium]|jgi:hypothetical protein|nr:hypothetical protein [Polyangiaceae bacterium]
MTGIGWAVEFVGSLVGQLPVVAEPEELPDDEEASAEPPEDEEAPDDEEPPEDEEAPAVLPDDDDEEAPPDAEPPDSGPPGVVEEGLELLEQLLMISSIQNERLEIV